MREDGEGTPLLRGRAAGGEVGEGAGDLQKAAEVQQDGRSSRCVTREQPQPALLSRVRSRPLLLAVAAVGAAVLVIAVGILSASEQAVSAPVGDTRLAATAPRQESSGAARDAGRSAATSEIGAGERDRGRSGAGSHERGTTKEAGGGWRSQPDRSPGMMQDAGFPSSRGMLFLSCTYHM